MTKQSNSIWSKFPNQRWQTILWATSLLLFIGISLYASYFVPYLEDQNANRFSDPRQEILRFGFNQLSRSPWQITAALFTFFLIAIFVFKKFSEKIRLILRKAESILFNKVTIQIITAILFGIFFYRFRNNFQTTDALIYSEWYPDYVNRNILLVRFDEIWEAHLHLRFYALTNDLFGWDVFHSMQVYACIVGAFFIFILFRLCKVLLPEQPSVGFLLLLSGGYMQFFFGEMEKYTLCAFFVFTYFLTATKYIKNNGPLYLPSLTLILAMTSHMIAIYRLPSLFLLFIIELHRRKYLSILFSALTFIALFNLTLLYFMGKGASLEFMLKTSWGLGRGGSILDNFLRIDKTYFWGQINLLFLIFPFLWFFIPSIFSIKKITTLAEKLVHLFFIVSGLAGSVFFFTWISAIGLYIDWNLFSIPLLPVITLSIYQITHLKSFPLKTQLITIAGLYFYLISYSWIFSNHFLFK